MKYEISQELAQALLNYLAEKPFKEVHVLLQALQQIKAIEEPKVTDKEES